MSEPVSALGGRTAEDGLEIRIEDLGPQGMITLRGDLADAAVKNAATGLAGVDMPGVRQIRREGRRGVAWMSPDELLVFLPYEETRAALATLDGALAGIHHLAVDVSDARALFRLTGGGVRETLAKGAPVDMSPAAFGQGDFRRTRIDQIAVAFGQVGAAPDVFELVCFRSVAADMFAWLETAGRKGSLPSVF